MALSLLAFLALLGRRFRASVVLGFAAGINLACIVPSYLTTSGVTRSDANALRIISVNVNTANQHYDLVQQLIREHDPDVILLMEVNAAWIDALDELPRLTPTERSNRETITSASLCSASGISRRVILFTSAQREYRRLSENSMLRGSNSRLSERTPCLLSAPIRSLSRQPTGGCRRLPGICIRPEDPAGRPEFVTLVVPVQAVDTRHEVGG